MQKPVSLLPIPLPPPEQRVARAARFAEEGEHRNRYHLPKLLETASPVGYRRRLSMNMEEAGAAASLLSLAPPDTFVAGPAPTEQALFEEASLGILSARQSTNYRGHHQISLGPEDSLRLAELLRKLKGLDRPVLSGVQYSHVCLSRPYRTPFTFLLTFIGHQPFSSLL
ncbi:MAG TPA: hypothetical protein PLA94_33055, partial [Myxococcota bacterium]|nr:hypothetical protein [Myxococcota bacterium]